jgi:hypothetical protein
VTSPEPLRLVPPPRGIDREQGYVTGGTGWWQLWDAEPTPELQWPHSIAVYDRMRRQDAQVISVLRAVTYPVQQTPWRIDPAGARDEVVEFVADNLGLLIKGADEDTTPPPRVRDRFSWDQHLEWALLQVVFGHMFFEQVARVGEDGKVRLRKLAPRWPRTIQRINVARDGGLVSIEQPPPPGESEPVVLGVDRLVAYVWEREGGDWTGRSLLRAAYKPWMLKDQDLLSWTLGIDRNSMGVPVFTDSPENNYREEGQKIASGFRSGATAGASLPNESKLELLGVQGTLIDPEKAVRYMDEQIARSVLAHFLNLGTQTGSWALGSTFAEFFTGSLNKLAKSIADVATQHVVEDLVDWNFGEFEPAPRVTFQPIGQNAAAIVQAVKTLIDAGAVFPDPKLDAFVRDVVGLPPKAPLPPRPGTTGETDNGDNAA